MWGYPDTWLDGDHPIAVGARTLDAVHTPGHTQGHYVFADRAAGPALRRRPRAAHDHARRSASSRCRSRQPLRDFLASLTKVRRLPDLRLLPAHGPVAPSVARPGRRAARPPRGPAAAAACEALGGGPGTAYDVAGELPWTRHEHRLADLDVFNQALASMETKAHLELLVARGQATRGRPPRASVFTAIG